VTLSCFEKLGIVKSLDENGDNSLHSTFMIISANGSQVFKNKLNAFESILYSSRPEDHFVIDFYLKQKSKFKSLECVLAFIAEKNHYGDQELYSFAIQEGFHNLARQIIRI
jgi:hypothetical protein